MRLTTLLSRRPFHLTYLSKRWTRARGFRPQSTQRRSSSSVTISSRLNCPKGPMSPRHALIQEKPDFCEETCGHFRRCRAKKENQMGHSNLTKITLTRRMWTRLACVGSWHTRRAVECTVRSCPETKDCRPSPDVNHRTRSGEVPC